MICEIIRDLDLKLHHKSHVISYYINSIPIKKRKNKSLLEVYRTDSLFKDKDSHHDWYFLLINDLPLVRYFVSYKYSGLFCFDKKKNNDKDLLFYFYLFVILY